MMNAIVVSDLHGNSRLYELLLRIADVWKISSVFIAGDLAPGGHKPADASEIAITEAGDTQRAFLTDIFVPLFEVFLANHRHTHVYAITGNDDRRINESLLRDFDEATKNFHLVNDRIVAFRDAKQIRSFFPGEVPQLRVAGYPYVPLGGGLLMDWVKHENRVGIVPPGMDPCMEIAESGIRTVTTACETSIEEDLRDFSHYLARHGLSEEITYDASRTIHLFHAPPYDTPLDQIAPQGRYDFVRLPDHIGSSEIRRFIEREQPHLALCGHCHEAVVLNDHKTDLGATRCVNPGSQAHLDVLSVVQFDPYRPTEMKHLFVNAS
jgi:Icc-related predicted phosphoesterase